MRSIAIGTAQQLNNNFAKADHKQRLTKQHQETFLVNSSICIYFKNHKTTKNISPVGLD